MRGQLDLFDSLPFGDVLDLDEPSAEPDPLDGEPEDDEDDEDEEPWENCHRCTEEEHTLFEAWLKYLNLPYVAVDEAKRAIFADCAVDGFDFLVYSGNGPNLLVSLDAAPDEGQLAKMEEWEKCFGSDFVAVFAWATGDDWVGITRADFSRTLNKDHARSLRDML